VRVQLPQKGPRFNILGAIAYNKLVGDKMRSKNRRHWAGGHLLSDALMVWRGQAKVKGKAKAPAPGEELEDYHGNMNADVFEMWFEKLCRDVLKKADDPASKYGPCLIKMDGAK
jgi:hypothetical protein